MVTTRMPGRAGSQRPQTTDAGQDPAGCGGDPGPPTWRAKVRDLPPLDEATLRPAQITAVHGIENCVLDPHFDRSLVQMAAGAGKTFTAVTEAYRLLTFGGFTRVLFLVDRNNLTDRSQYASVSSSRERLLGPY